jgi:hypothetical protein
VSTPIKSPNGFEFELIKALRAIVSETMAFPPVRPSSAESYLPPELITQAQDALKLYGLHIERNPDMMTVKTIILTAPQGWGKTTNAEALRQEFGCNRVVDNWKPMDCTFEGALHLTNTPPHQIPDGWLLHAELVERGWGQQSKQGGAL